jgi:hypothetical protein
VDRLYIKRTDNVRGNIPKKKRCLGEIKTEGFRRKRGP